MTRLSVGRGRQKWRNLPRCDQCRGCAAIRSPRTRHARSSRHRPRRVHLLAPPAIAESPPTQAPLRWGSMFVALICAARSPSSSAGRLKQRDCDRRSSEHSAPGVTCAASVTSNTCARRWATAILAHEGQCREPPGEMADRQPAPGFRPSPKVACSGSDGLDFLLYAATSAKENRSWIISSSA